MGKNCSSTLFLRSRREGCFERNLREILVSTVVPFIVEVELKMLFEGASNCN